MARVTVRKIGANSASVAIRTLRAARQRLTRPCRPAPWPQYGHPDLPVHGQEDGLGEGPAGHVDAWATCCAVNASGGFSTRQGIFRVSRNCANRTGSPCAPPVRRGPCRPADSGRIGFPAGAPGCGRCRKEDGRQVADGPSIGRPPAPVKGKAGGLAPGNREEPGHALHQGGNIRFRAATDRDRGKASTDTTPDGNAPTRRGDRPPGRLRSAADDRQAHPEREVKSAFFSGWSVPSRLTHPSGKMMTELFP